MRDNYIKCRDIPSYLAAMGNNLVSAEMSAGRTDDIVESQNPNGEGELDTSNWRIIEEDAVVDDLEIKNNPYKDRQIGRNKEKDRLKPKVGRKKCTVCEKGFNSKSSVVACNACDKLTHVRCAESFYDEENYMCVKCKSGNDTSNLRHDAIGQELIASNREAVSVANEEETSQGDAENVTDKCANDLYDFL